MESTFTVPGRDPWITDRTRYFGCDTEFAFIDIREQSPVGHGAVLCFSIYGGPDINFNKWVIFGGRGVRCGSEPMLASLLLPAPAPSIETNWTLVH